MEFDEIHFPTITSTNDYAKSHLEEFNFNKITLIRADGQTAGRGRHGHQWHSPSKKDLLVTFVFSLPSAQKHLASLGQLLSFSTAILCRSLGLKPELKWPNDVHIQGKKLAGILCETVAQRDDIAVVMGIGLNVNATHHDLSAIDQPSTSLSIELGHPLDLAELLELLKREFLKDLTLFKQEGFSPFARDYQDLLSLHGKVITVLENGQTISGLCVGIKEDGRLLVETPDGHVTPLTNGKIKK
jgi:BirA family biotin operon repressor/biotin-[acetyl-CoA-carboxylase] ligase